MKRANPSYWIAVVGSTSLRKKLWRWSNWKKLYPIIGRLLDLASRPAAIRSSQVLDGKSTWFGFGRMTWSPENNRKWTTACYGQEHRGKAVEFFDTQIWAPDWTVTHRSRGAPEVLVRVDRCLVPRRLKQGLFVAVQRDLFRKHQGTVKDCIADIAAAFPVPALRCTTTRKWAEEVYRDGVSNPLHVRSVNDLAGNRKLSAV